MHTKKTPLDHAAPGSPSKATQTHRGHQESSRGKPEQVDVVVVGAGLAGLCAAVTAAQKGLSVVVLERSKTPGGYARSTLQGGAVVNWGPRALYKDGWGHRTLQSLGVEVAGARPGGDGLHAMLEGKLVPLPSSLGTLLRADFLTWRQRARLSGLMLTMMRQPDEALAHQTWGQWLDGQDLGPALRGLIEMFGRLTTYSNIPQLVSAHAVLSQIQHAFRHGVLYLDGGWQSIVEALCERLAVASGRLETSARVVRCERVADGRWSVETADGLSFDAGQVVLAVTPKAAAQIVPQLPVVQEWADGAVAVRAQCLDVVLESLPRPDVLSVQGLDEPIYFSVHSETARLAPKGQAVIHVARYLGDETGVGKGPLSLEAMMDRLQPGWRRVLVWKRSLPSMAVSPCAVLASKGGVFGRPGPAVPGQQGLFVAGDWVGQRGQLACAALASGAQAGQMVAESMVSSDAPRAWG